MHNIADTRQNRTKNGKGDDRWQGVIVSRYMSSLTGRNYSAIPLTMRNGVMACLVLLVCRDVSSKYF